MVSDGGYDLHAGPRLNSWHLSLNDRRNMFLENCCQSKDPILSLMNHFSNSAEGIIYGHK